MNEEIGTVVAVLGLLLAVIRYLVRLGASIERAGEVSRDTVDALRRHTEASEQFHTKVNDRIGDHGARLAVLESRTRARP